MKTKKSVKKAASKRSNSSKSSKKNGNSGMKKQYLKSGDTCNVTFRLPKEAAPEAREITVVGDFNNWNIYGKNKNQIGY